jgi:putative ATPase
VGLFDGGAVVAAGSGARQTPLAERMRPRTVEEFAGQTHLLGEGKPLRLAIENDDAASMIFWGPPGVGKTRLRLSNFRRC